DAPAALACALGSGMVDENSPHRLGGEIEEPPSISVLRREIAAKLQISFMNQLGGTKRMSRRLVRQPGPSDGAKLVIHLRQQFPTVVARRHRIVRRTLLHGR